MTGSDHFNEGVAVLRRELDCKFEVLKSVVQIEESVVVMVVHC